MRFGYENSWIGRLLGRLPLPVRIVLVGSVLAGLVFAQWQQQHGRATPFALDAAETALFVVVCGLGLVEYRRTLRSKHRRPFVLTRGWMSLAVGVGALVCYPVASLFDDDPRTTPARSLALLGVAVVIIALVVQYLLMPVGEQYVDRPEPEPERRPTTEADEFGLNWSASARRANAGRDRSVPTWPDAAATPLASPTRDPRRD